MKKENISDALNYIDDNIIESADTLRIFNKKYKIMRIARTCVAACLIVAIGISSVIWVPKLISKNSNPSKNSQEKLPLLDATVQFGNMGFEGYMAHDISELVNANPWYEGCEITTLPVYKNALALDENHEYTEIDLPNMRNFIIDVSKRFGLNENEINITQGEAANNIANNSLFVETDNFEIKVTPELTAEITYEPSVSLPKEYNLSHYANYNDTLDVAKYFQNKYKDVINFKSPKINITGGEYNIYNQQMYHIEFFDDSKDLTQDIINYNFNRIAFYCDDEDMLWLIRIYNPDLSQKIGDYPIITKEKATELLSNGNYATNVPSNYEMKTENVKKVELVYRNTYWLDKIYMPYYKFYIEIPEFEDRFGNGLKNYGIYYVPAVDGKYISNMPTYDGSFN